MTFIPNQDKIEIGSLLYIESDVRVLAGVLKSGSVVEVIDLPDSRGDFKVRDCESGYSIYLNPLFSKYSIVK